MAAEQKGKKWGTIFMGEREASVEQLNAMQEHVNRDKLQKEQTEDYLERVKARAVERARTILGEAYTERQKVLDEARGEATIQKRLAAQECERIKAEGEEIRKQAQTELDAARAEMEEARKLRESAHAEGYEAGLKQSSTELNEFRAQMGTAVATLLRAVERERKAILENWREDLVELVKTAIQAGTGFILQKEHDAIMRQLVFQALDLLENRISVSVRVNPEDEETVSDMFRAARERAPELKQWTVTGDDSIESGGLVADSGSGSVDFRRANFREMVDNALCHLGLPESAWETGENQEIARLVEQEIANIAGLTPEEDPAPLPEEPPAVETAPEEPEAAVATDVEAEMQASDEAPALAEADEPESVPLEPISEELAQAEAEITEDLAAPGQAEEEHEAQDETLTEDGNTSLAALEDELFPLEETESPDPVQEGQPAENNLDSKTLSEGGFL